MLKNILKETWAFKELSQELSDEARAEGREEGLLEARIGQLGFLATDRFPQLVDLITSQAEKLAALPQYDRLLFKLVSSQSVEDARELLLSALHSI